MEVAVRNKVQRLYDACASVFRTGEDEPLTFEQIRWLQSLLDGVGPADVGIDGYGDEGPRVDERSPTSRRGLVLGHALEQITYIHIHECQDFSMGVFCFPAGATMPLHDHPGMVVLTKVLYGSVSWNAYDWVSNPRKNGLAKVVAEERILQSSTRTSVLFPRSGGNMHSFTALTPCAILDVLTPPYSDELGRPSTYYIDIPIPWLPGFCILEEAELPDDLVVAGAPYLGPELIVVDEEEEDDDDDDMY
ncbi:unnamed protein product [Musa banksii]